MAPCVSGKDRRPLPGRETGFSLLEVLLALVVLGLGASLLANSATGGLASLDRAWNKVAADRIARSTLDRIGIDLHPAMVPYRLPADIPGFEVEIRRLDGAAIPNRSMERGEIVVSRAGRVLSRLPVLLTHGRTP